MSSRQHIPLAPADRPPRRWSSWPTWMINLVFKSLGHRPPFTLTWREMRQNPSPWQAGIEGAYSAFFRSHLPVAFGLLLICVLAAAIWKSADSDLSFRDLWPEIGGMALDIFVILVVYESYQQARAGAVEIERQHEIIDDYKRWDAAEARLRIAGAIRRLNRRGVFKINLSGVVLSDFDFAKSGVKNLAGSIFYDGSWGDPHRDASVRLTRVSFGWVNCSDVQFSPFDPFETLIEGGSRAASLVDCNFIRADLRGATFNGADLIWSQRPPEELYEYEGDDDGGANSYQVAYGYFDGAKLAGASFCGCVFRNADFRGAEELQQAEFFRAVGLDSAKFSNEADRQYALSSSSKKNRR